jgi:hypothetical protein
VDQQLRTNPSLAHTVSRILDVAKLGVRKSEVTIDTWPGTCVLWRACFADYHLGLADAAAAAADRPSGLPSELPGIVADATAWSQLRDTSVWFVGEPLLLGGGGRDLSRWLNTMQFDQANRSPTVADTTGVNPAELSAELASPYFWPTTLGEVLASAVAATAMPRAATAAAMAAANGACLVMNVPWYVLGRQ